MAGWEERFARGANAHLSDDEAVAKMGHPALWLSDALASAAAATHQLQDGEEDVDGVEIDGE